METVFLLSMAAAEKITVADHLPVYNAEPIANIIGPFVIMFQVISVFPDINVENWAEPAGQRRFLVWSGDDPKPAGPVAGKPGVARTKDGKRCGTERFLKPVKVCKTLIDRSCQNTERPRPRRRAHPVKIETVVINAAGIA